ncbi:MAG: peptide deformylase [Anaerolineales bacterium]|nr:peptide deformylase [Anaerolineales bacterium]
MPVRQIVYSDDPILRRSSRQVRRITPEVRTLIDDMLDSMRASNGAGLAAVQIGVPERVIVIELPVEPDDEEDEIQDDERGGGDVSDRPVERYIVINPEIRRKSREMVDGIEGCLSVPGWTGEVSRHRSVTVTGLDLRGKPVRIKADGWLARVFQHEIDHCEGVLYIDRIDDPEKIWPVAEGEEEALEAAQAVSGRTPSGEI